MVPKSRKGSALSSNLSSQPLLHTSPSSPPPPSSSHADAPSASSSPVAQVYLLLSTIKEDRDDPRKWETQTESLRKLIDEHGMDAFARYFGRLVAGNASQIFPSQGRPVASGGNNHLLVTEMRKLSREFPQARKIAESIETGTEDIFRDFDLSSFMEHFQLDALEKTLLALAFKLGTRADLKTKADAILSTNFPTFVNILSRPTGEHADLDADFVAELLDRFIQLHPPNFNAAAKRELEHKVLSRYSQLPDAKPPPSQVLAALDLVRILADRPPSALALYIHRTGGAFTSDEDTCTSYLQNRPTNIQPNEEQVSSALMYATISQTPRHNPSILVASLRRILNDSFRWQDVVSYFDQTSARITSSQFLRLYHALLPIALDDPEGFNIQRLWGGEWQNPETQLSFICAYASLKPEQLDATTIPNLKPTLKFEDYAQTAQSVREKATYAVKHPLVSEAALTAVFNVALHSMHASQSTEAKRLFQDVVVPNLAIFVVSASGVPRPWPTMAEETLVSLFDGFLSKVPDADFVMDSLWRRDKEWVKSRLIDAHALKPMILSSIFEHAVKQGWLEELVYLPNGFGLDMASFAHAQGFLDLQEWAARQLDRRPEVASALLQFLMIKASLEMAYQRPVEGVPPVKATTTLQVKTVSQLLGILQDFLPKSPVPELIVVQRHCITAYPRLINYGEGYDDIIDANGRDGNILPAAANARMEEHYKKMYGDEIQVADIVDILERYKHSRDPLDQDVFACMIHGLFDEYAHYVDYPLEALATTAVLFGGIISHKLISDLPLQIGLGMILEAVRDHPPDQPMYKFGLQALIQLFGRFREWPGFCQQLLAITGLQTTEAWKQASEAVRQHDEAQLARSRNGGAMLQGGLPVNDQLANGKPDDVLGAEQHMPAFISVNVDPPPPGIMYEDPSGDAQGKIQFVLNNLTETTLESMFKELHDMLEVKHQQWFASHLVEERAKMQPNYHSVYLRLVKQFEDKTLWAEVLRETYISVQRMLNSEVTMQSSTERTHLKNLGGWLGLLTLARDIPIKQKNIAFKQLLMEAHDTKRLIVVIPFVCKVLHQGARSKVFRPPNPWLMDIIHLLIELYHNAELKLNLKFEIEVLCKGLDLDHKSIEPSGEILNRVPVEDVGELVGPEALDSFESMSLNGMTAVGSALSGHPTLAIPDLASSLSVPQTEVVNANKLHDIINQALTRALQDIIQPVVDRSVTIAAISTHQMVKKDFATEPDENKLRTAAFNMVKSTAGSLALVTSKEPLRANFMNYLRNLANELPQGLPEGIIMLCVNSNMELASSVIEKSAEERAIPEIEELIEPLLEERRRHRLQRPNEAFIDHPTLNRWAMTIPHPFKMQPSLSGLGPEQMAIYDDFARQSRATVASSTAPSHVASASDVRSLTNEVLGDQYNAVANLPTPAETPSIPHMGVQMPHYPQPHVALTNGRQAGVAPIEARGVVDRINKLLSDLNSTASTSPEEHFAALPRSHEIINIIDALIQTIIKTQQSEEFAFFAAQQIAQILFRQPENTLQLESLVHVLETLRRVAGAQISQEVRHIFTSQPGDTFLHLPLIRALVNTDLIDWRSVDQSMTKALAARQEGSLLFLEELFELTLFDNPINFWTDFVHSIHEAWSWLHEEPDVPGGKSLREKLLAGGPRSPTPTKEDQQINRLLQLDYVFDEWTHLCNGTIVPEPMRAGFVQQVYSRNMIGSKDDLLEFIRRALDRSVELFEQFSHAGGVNPDGYQAIDALVKFIVTDLLQRFAQSQEADSSPILKLFDIILIMAVLVLNDHHVRRGDGFNQRVFFRFFSNLLHELAAISERIPEVAYQKMLLSFSDQLYSLRPSRYPGFVFSWSWLMSHRAFMPAMICLPDNSPNRAGWVSFTKLLIESLKYLGHHLKALHVPNLAKELYQNNLKLLAIMYHDFPVYLSANHVQICQAIPPHAQQLLSMVLSASPSPLDNVVDPFHSALKVDRLSDMKETPLSTYDFAKQLREVGLYDLLEHALQNGPSEEAIAQITHTISQPDEEEASTAFGFVPVGCNRRIIDAVVAHIGHFAMTRSASKPDVSVFLPGASDFKTLQFLVTELNPEARYYLLFSMVNELRFECTITHYFSQAILEMFGGQQDLSDAEEMEIRQQIARLLLERIVGFWPQPWGLMVTTVELVKNEKYHFFELPFIKLTPEVAERFLALSRLTPA
ncbi:CCR4-Not complex component, Not1-domain-containing protein [Podospora fimiseda]|uniref:General negative regulator of transcription subunit 1 n=1 Tax=Podospora fimiseda TaxID=252190 RepID=A0AAN7BU20_9PEZI|nr:CCR4-Not complex component, Not1-domain-containing protein [Podospora fimiseda]